MAPAAATALASRSFVTAQADAAPRQFGNTVCVVSQGWVQGATHEGRSVLNADRDDHCAGRTDQARDVFRSGRGSGPGGGGGRIHHAGTAIAGGWFCATFTRGEGADLVRDGEPARTDGAGGTRRDLVFRLGDGIMIGTHLLAPGPVQSACGSKTGGGLTA